MYLVRSKVSSRVRLVNTGTELVVVGDHDHRGAKWSHLSVLSVHLQKEKGKTFKNSKMAFDNSKNGGFTIHTILRQTMQGKSC